MPQHNSRAAGQLLRGSGATLPLDFERFRLDY
jgi:hypothetical protein